MKYLMTILMTLTLSVAFADDDPNGECRRLFKASKQYIKKAQSTLEKVDSLYFKQEKAIISKNAAAKNRITKSIIKSLNNAKSNYQSVVPLSSKAMRLCSGRANKAKKFIVTAKLGIKDSNFKIRINKDILSN